MTIDQILERMFAAHTQSQPAVEFERCRKAIEQLVRQAEYRGQRQEFIDRTAVRISGALVLADGFVRADAQVTAFNFAEVLWAERERRRAQG